jgi:hypothetical protein
LRLGGWLPGKKLPSERILERRADYVATLLAADLSATTGAINLSALQSLLTHLLHEQDADAKSEAEAEATAAISGSASSSINSPWYGPSIRLMPALPLLTETNQRHLRPANCAGTIEGLSR